LPPIGEKRTIKEQTDGKRSFPESDFLPQELLVTLSRRDSPEGRAQQGKSAVQGKSQLDKSSLRPPANVWGHPKRRTKYKHLVDNAPCICGAGKDISFLYDTGRHKDHLPTSKTVMDSLVPSEFHIIQHPGVHGTEFRDEWVVIFT
jgi:hypothetical protein